MVQEENNIEDMDGNTMTPMYVGKIDEMHDFIKEQRTLQETPLNKYLSYAVFATLIVVGLMYSQMNGMHERVRVSESKLDFVLESFDNYKNSVKALNGIVCIQCHNTPDMMLQNLGVVFSDVDSFKTYVRTGGRQKNGMVMPPIPAESVDDYTLVRIYNSLK